jgi:hypothetical protein
MSTTGVKYPGSTATASESPWSDNNWSNAGYVVADDTNYASITATSYDTDDQSYVLKAYNFDFSAIPNGSQILGVTCVVRAWYANGTGSIDLVQLLDASRAKVGTNKASTPQALTTSQANYTFGGTTDLWSNALTAAWIKDADFGVAIGCLSTGTDTDVYIDFVTLEVTYREPIVAGTTSYGVTGTAVAMAIALPMLSAVYGITGGAVTMGKGAGPLSPEAGSYSQSGTDATLKHTFKLPAGAGSYSISGTDVTLKFTKKIVPATDSYSVSGSAITFGATARTITGGDGSYSLNGTAAAFTISIPVNSGVYPIQGTAASLRWGQSVAGGAGSYEISGQDVSLIRGSAGDAAGGSYGLTGTNVTLKRVGYVSLEGGSVELTGTAATLTLATPGAKSISAGGEAYALSGTAVAMTRSVPADYGDYDLTGSNVTLQYSQASFTAAGGSYAITGGAAGLVHDVWFDPGNYFITGTSANLLYIRYRLTAAAGSYAVTGGTTLKLEIGMPCAAGAFAITGTPAALAHGVASGYQVGIGAGSYTYTDAGSDEVNFRVDRLIDARGLLLPPGLHHSYEMELSAAALKLNRVALQPEVGLFEIVGAEVFVGRTYKLAIEAGDYSVTGVAAGLDAGTPPSITADSGEYELSGDAISMSIINFLSIGEGVYAIDGAQATLKFVKKFVPDAGSYSVEGTAVSISSVRGVVAGDESYAVSGDNVTLTHPIYDKELVIGDDDYAITGVDARMSYGMSIAAAGEAYEISGADVEKKRTYRLIAGPGSYSGWFQSSGGKRFMNIWRRA